MKILTLLLFIFLSISPKTYGSTDSGYKYILKNYFSARRTNFTSYKGSPRNLTFYMGPSIYRETKEKILSPISSFLIGVNHRIKEFPTVGEFNLQLGIQSIKLENQRATMIEINPTFSIPDVRSGFPFYAGFGLGMGFFPRHVIKELPPFSFNTQFFTGIRLLDLYYNLGLNAEIKLKMQIPTDDLKTYLEIFGILGIIFSF